MMQIKFEGGQELLKALEELSPRVSKKMQREALVDAAEQIRRPASKYAPRGDEAPHLADNIVVSNAKGQDAQEVAIAIGPSKKFFYGSFWELGTSMLPAPPFLRPAFDQGVSKVLKEFADALWLALTARGVRRGMTTSDSPVSGPGRLL